MRVLVDPNKKITFGFFKEVVNVLQAPATADTYGYIQATGTYVEGTTYYTDNTGTTEVDTTGFVEGETDVSEYYVYGLIQGTSGRLTPSDKKKLDSINIATSEEVQSAIEGLENL